MELKLSATRGWSTDRMLQTAARLRLYYSHADYTPLLTVHKLIERNNQG